MMNKPLRTRSSKQWKPFSLNVKLHSVGASVKLTNDGPSFLIQVACRGGFRWFVQREAGELDLRGWVRNTEEGEVEVVASGSEAYLAELRASLRADRARRVDRLVEHQLAESEAADLSSFRIDGAW